MAEKLGFDFVLKKFSERGLFLLSEYRNTEEKVELIDSDGYKYYTSYEFLFSRKNNGTRGRFFGSNPFTEYNIKLWLSKNNKNFYLIDGQINEKTSAKTTLMFKCISCPDDEYPFPANWNKVYGGEGCKYCSGHDVGKFNNLEYCFPEIAKEWNYERNSLFPKDFTKRSSQNVWWKCSRCCHEWEAYISNRTGNRRQGCPKCRESKGEKKISLFLKDNRIPFIYQYSIDECRNKKVLFFDFAILNSSNNICFLCEYDGELHYQEHRYIEKIKAKEKLNLQKKRDEIKNEYCRQNDIALIRIPYWEFDNIEKILAEKLGL